MTKPAPEGRKPVDADPVPPERAPPDFIGENLRRLFGAVESEPLPERLTALLRKLADEGGK